jgi:hypothetical protein
MKSKSDDEKNFRNAVDAHSCRITHSFGTKECSHYLWSLRIEINSFPNHQSGMKTTKQVCFPLQNHIKDNTPLESKPSEYIISKCLSSKYCPLKLLHTLHKHTRL